MASNPASEEPARPAVVSVPRTGHSCRGGISCPIREGNRAGVGLVGPFEQRVDLLVAEAELGPVEQPLVEVLVGAPLVPTKALIVVDAHHHGDLLAVAGHVLDALSLRCAQYLAEPLLH